MNLRDPSDENLCVVCLGDDWPRETPEPTAAAAATQDDDATDPETVSYTHLTLPTILLV